MLRKTATHQYFFKVDLNWLSGREGIVTAKDVKDKIYVATASVFMGGIPDKWGPEHLLLGALCSSFMATFLTIAEKQGLGLVQFECSAIGHIQPEMNQLAFTTIDVYPKIKVATIDDRALLSDILIKTHQHCIVTNSIKSQVTYHEEVLVNNPLLQNH